MALPTCYQDDEIKDFKTGGTYGGRVGKEEHMILVEKPEKQNSGNTQAQVEEKTLKKDLKYDRKA